MQNKNFNYNYKRAGKEEKYMQSANTLSLKL